MRQNEVQGCKLNKRLRIGGKVQLTIQYLIQQWEYLTLHLVIDAKIDWHTTLGFTFGIKIW